MLNRILGGVGLVILAAGLVFAFRHVSVNGTDCGSVIQPATGITPMDCDNRVADRERVVAILGGAGLVGGVMSIGIAILRDREKVAEVVNRDITVNDIMQIIAAEAEPV